MKIEIDMNLVITSKEQVRVGMHLWGVGQGGITNICEPVYKGRVLGFGDAQYRWNDGPNASHFILNEDPTKDLCDGRLYTDVFVAMVKPYGAGARSAKPEYMDRFDISEDTIKSGVEYPLYTVGGYCVTTESYLPDLANNWYMCDSLEKAEKVYQQMMAKWTERHEQERAEYQEKCSRWNEILDEILDDIYDY